MINEEIFSFLSYLKNKEPMVTGEFLDLKEFKCFLDGFILGLGISGFIISQWLRKKTNKEINISWSSYILSQNLNLSKEAGLSPFFQEELKSGNKDN